MKRLKAKIFVAESKQVSENIPDAKRDAHLSPRFPALESLFGLSSIF
jgi:hypothetical protein